MSDSSTNTGRKLAAALVLTGLAAVFFNLVAVTRPPGELRVIKDYTPWSAACITVAETLPVQDGGRVKPLATYAGFTMLAIHGSRSMSVAGNDGKAQILPPTAWLLDTLFRPQFAIQHPTFRVDNSAVLEAIGAKPRAKRDRYSYAELVPGLEKLVELADAYNSLDPKHRDSLQQQILDLAYNVRDFEYMLGQFAFARSGVDIGNEPSLQRLDISTVMDKAARIRDDIATAKRDGQTSRGPAEYLYEEATKAASLALHGMHIFPPDVATQRTWQNSGERIMCVLTGETPTPAHAIQDIIKLEQTSLALATSEAAFLHELTALRNDLTQRASACGEGRHLALEAAYNRADWFFNAFLLFFVGALCAVAMWMAGPGRRGAGILPAANLSIPQGTDPPDGNGRAGRILAGITLGWTLSGLVLCIIAIVERCLIMQRAPVGNLYDTIIFISAACVSLALVIECITRRRFALGLAPILGTLLVFLSRRYEMGDPKDHLDPLVAVLASNFWLTIHVITITLGYAAGLLCALLSALYILMRGLRLDRADGEMRRSLSLAVYGMVCLTLFLSLVGTVLGGIWANDSWGRFWGWDPKENGALLIVIWTLVILHAKLGGFIKEWGLHLASVFTACIVVFSWWHVNFLGVGLHNYGFTAGKDVLWTFYLALLGLIIFGSISKWLESRE
ncbi:MAG: cytochrome c biogenesis protein CcsA [Verrucomicrobiota bacterium]